MYHEKDPSPRDQSGTQILDAALATFVRGGLRRTTMADVARAAGVTRVTVYRHFGSKDDLLRAVVWRESQRFLEALGRAIETREDEADRLAEGFAFALTYLRDHPLLRRLLDTEPEQIVPFLTTEAGSVLDAARVWVATALARSVEAGRLPPLDVDVAAEVLTRLTVSLLLTPDTVLDVNDAESARNFAREYLMPALLAGARSESLAT